MPKDMEHRGSTPDLLLISARRRFALAVAVLLVVATLGTVIVKRYMAAPPPGRPPASIVPAGTFHLTDDQLRSIATKPIVTMKFHSEEVTDCTQAALLSDTVALFQVAGGGCWNRGPVGTSAGGG